MKCPNCKIELLGSMKRCPKCGYDITKGAIDKEYVEQNKERIEKEAAGVEQRKMEEARLQEYIKQREEFAAKLPKLREEFLCSSGYNFEGYRITKYVGIRSGEIVLGTGVFSEISAAVNDFFGDQNGIIASKITLAKERALATLIDNCIIAGANAVIGVDLDFMTYSINNLIVASANGTAVVIEKE